MKVEIELPSEFQGTVMGNLNSRRGIIMGTVDNETYSTITAYVPLSEMFGYIGDLRSITQGKGEYTMEFCKYAPLPKILSEKLVIEFEEEQKN